MSESAGMQQNDSQAAKDSRGLVYHSPKLTALGSIQSLVQVAPRPSGGDSQFAEDGTAST